MEGGFAYADDRRRDRAARGLEARVVEACDDACVERFRTPHLFDHTRNREDLVVIAFDARRAVGGVCGGDLGARDGDGPRRGFYLPGHGDCRVRIDDQDAHGHQTSPPRYRLLTRSSARSSLDTPERATRTVD